MAEDPWTVFDEACALIDGWQLDRAEQLLARLKGDDALAAAVARERAMLCDLRGEIDRAEQLYRRAADLDPEYCPLPVRMSSAEAGDLLAAAVRRLPADVRGALDNLAIELVDMPDPVRDADPDTSPDMLGLYEGVPITDPDAARSLRLPGRIRVFKRNVERLVLDRDELIAELHITLLHEIGHHLGWDEDDLHARGLG